MSMLIGKIMDSYRKAQVKQTGIAIGQVVSQIQLYYTDCGHYPASLDNLVTADSSCSNWGPEPYLKKAPKDAWENDLIYEADGGNFKVKSTGGPTKKEISSDTLAQ
jgi:general secretion pathway protein G